MYRRMYDSGGLDFLFKESFAGLKFFRLAEGISLVHISPYVRIS